MPRALISVYDKTGIVEFAKNLVEMGWEIISTGGTKKTLQDNNIKAIDISEITNFPECFDGRVKTLHPRIHGGLLYVRDNESHVETLNKLDILPIDMVVNNLYPFKQTLENTNATHEDIIENIDIGGPSMLRAAAKNYKFVTVIVDPKDYENVLTELKNNNDTSLETKQYLSAKVFMHTGSYDALISSYFNSICDIKYPEIITKTYSKQQDLRYGENPHQDACFYSEIFEKEGTLSNAIKLHGKDLSFNNINDTNGALEILKEFEEPTIVAVKHANPCGVGSAETIEKAFIKAYEADKVSIFGGIIASNREINKEAAEIIKINKIFIEVIVAPSYSDEALEILRQKRNVRILELSNINKNDYTTFDMKKVLGGLLVQDRNSILLNGELEVVTDRKPTEKEMEDLLFAWKVVKNTKSNGIAIAKDKQTVAVGPGQVSRIWALENAIKQGEENVSGSVLASDAFFPFDDCVIQAANSKITAIIQPGGSIRDKESIEACNKHGIAMVFTNTRHFKH